MRKKTKLANICDLIDEKILLNKIINHNLFKMNYISTENMLPDKNGIIPPKSIPSIGKGCKYKTNDTLLSNIRPYFKKIWLAKNEGACSNDVLIFRAKESYYHDFLYYNLANDAFFEYAMKTSKGTKMPRGDKTAIKQYDIYDFDYRTQQKLTKLLRLLDDKIELNRQINTNLEQQAQAIFKSWFIDFEPFGGTMPDDWSISTLNQISKLNAGGDKPLKISNIKTKQYLYPVYSNGLANDGLYGYTDNAKIFNESVTVSARGTIGSICLRHTPFVPIVRLISIIPNSFITAKYLYCWLKHSHITGTGTTQQQLTIPDFGEKEIIVPPIDLMYYFTETVEPLFNSIWLTQDEIYTLTALRDTLLPKLMSGEIDVSKIELD